MQQLRKIIAAVGVALFAMFIAAPAQATPPPLDHKVWVCKYTTTPGGDEVLKNGNDGLVWVSQNTVQIEGKDRGDVAVGDAWVDRHVKSLVIQIAGERPSITECPGYVPPTVDICNANYEKETVPADSDAASQFPEWNKRTCVPPTVDICNANYEKETVPADSDAASEFPEWNAETCVPPNEEPGYVIVAWQMPTWEGPHSPSWPQSYVTHEGQGTPNLSQLDSYLDSNFEYGCFQIDIYFDSETTTNLIAGGVLNGPNNPTEDLIAGGWGTAYKLYAVGGPFAKGSACEPPPPPMCANIDMSIKDAKAAGYLVDDNNNCTEKKVDICHHDQGSPVYKVINIAESAVPAHLAHQWGADYLVSELPEGWTIDGDTCVPPPTECTNMEMTVDDALEAGYYVDEENNCYPPVEICGPNYTGVFIPYDEYVAGNGAYDLYDPETCVPPRAPTPPSLLADVTPVCEADYPYFEYDVTLVDPDEQVDPTAAGKVTFKFMNPLDPTQFIEIEKTLTNGTGSGKFLWPGADENMDGTPDGWPGWVSDGLGGFTKDLTQNYGWTRDGLNVDVSVNPTVSITGLEYPSATDPCEPVVVEQTFSAPPATPVTAEAQYAG